MSSKVGRHDPVMDTEASLAEAPAPAKRAELGDMLSSRVGRDDPVMDGEATAPVKRLAKPGHMLPSKVGSDDPALDSEATRGQAVRDLMKEQRSSWNMVKDFRRPSCESLWQGTVMSDTGVEEDGTGSAQTLWSPRRWGQRRRDPTQSRSALMAAARACASAQISIPSGCGSSGILLDREASFASSSPETPTSPISWARRTSSSERPRRGGSLDWLAGALREERLALNQELVKRHELLLRRLDVELRQRAPTIRMDTFDVPDEGMDLVSSMPTTPFSKPGATRPEAPQEPRRLPEVVTEIPLAERPSALFNNVSKKNNGKLRTQVSEDSQYSSCRCLAAVEMVVRRPWFDVFYSCLIVINLLCLALEAQYRSIGVCQDIGFPQCRKTSEEAWPGGRLAFDVLDWIFGIFFSVEVLAKLLATRLRFVCSEDWTWNLFDVIVTATWLVTKIMYNHSFPMDASFFRVARLARLLRFLRLFRTAGTMSVVHLMWGSLKASAHVLLWSAVFLSAIMLTSALVLNYWLEPFLTDTRQPEDLRHKVFNFFGSTSRGFLTMFELTLGNWVPVTRLLHDDISEWYGPFLLFYQIVVTFAVIRVITGIFMHETFQVAGTDDELMIAQRERQICNTTAKMKLLFQEADTSGDGFLDSTEFEEVVKDQRVKVWLSAMDLEVEDAQKVFSWVEQEQSPDKNFGRGVSAADFCAGLKHLKGSARSMDMCMLMQDIHRIHESIQMLCDQLIV